MYKQHAQYSKMYYLPWFGGMLFMLATFVLTVSCGGAPETCTTESVPSLFVTVLDGANDNQVLKMVDEISYVGKDGEHHGCGDYLLAVGEEANELPPPPWLCAFEQKEVTVTVQLGSRTVTETFHVDADYCHVITKEVSIVLP